MIKVAYTTAFKRAFRKRIKSTQSEEIFYKKLELFIDNPHHTSLRTHKLVGNLAPDLAI